MGDDLGGIVGNIRAIIVSSKFPVPLRNLSRDYETIIGTPIPYRDFNHNTLESFLGSISSLKLTGSGREMFIQAVQSEASSHISDMVAKQKTTSRKSVAPSRRGGYRGRGGYPSQGGYQRSVIAQRSAQREPLAPIRQTNRPSTSQLPPTRRESYTSSNGADKDNLVVKVAHGDRREVSIGDTYGSSNVPHSSQKEHSFKYDVPPRFKKRKEASAVSEITKDVEETLFLDSPREADPRVFPDNDSDIISALKPGQMIAVGRLKESLQNRANKRPALIVAVNSQGSRSCFYWHN